MRRTGFLNHVTFPEGKFWKEGESLLLGEGKRMCPEGSRKGNLGQRSGEPRAGRWPLPGASHDLSKDS